MGHGHSVPGVFRMGFYRDEGSQIKQTVSSVESGKFCRDEISGSLKSYPLNINFILKYFRHFSYFKNMTLSVPLKDIYDFASKTNDFRHLKHISLSFIVFLFATL